MDQILGPFAPRIYALLRIVAGFMFAFHGVQKIFGAFGRDPVELASLMGVAGIVELVGGLLVMLGVFTSWAAFICSGQMAVAYFMAHQPQGLWPIQNKGELAALYAFVFLYIAARGTGVWGVMPSTARD